MKSRKSPLADGELKVGGITKLGWGKNGICTVIVPQDQYAFESLKLLWKSGKWLNVSISSVGIESRGIERVRLYKFLGQIKTVQRTKNGSLIKIHMYEDRPEMITVNLNESTAESAFNDCCSDELHIAEKG